MGFQELHFLFQKHLFLIAHCKLDLGSFWFWICLETTETSLVPTIPTLGLCVDSSQATQAEGLRWGLKGEDLGGHTMAPHQCLGVPLNTAVAQEDKHLNSISEKLQQNSLLPSGKKIKANFQEAALGVRHLLFVTSTLCSLLFITLLLFYTIKLFYCYFIIL